MRHLQIRRPLLPLTSKLKVKKVNPIIIRKLSKPKHKPFKLVTRNNYSLCEKRIVVVFRNSKTEGWASKSGNKLHHHHSHNLLSSPIHYHHLICLFLSILNSQSLAALLLLFLIPLLFIHDSTAFRFHYHFPFLGSISFAPYKYYKNLIHTQTERERKERKDVVISYCQNSVRSVIVVRKYIQEPVKTNFKFFSSVFFFFLISNSCT